MEEGERALASDSSPLQRLVQTFHSLIDEALIVAIANDYDLSKPSEFDAANATLTDLARDVSSEEATGFNPSGIAQELERVEASEVEHDSSTTTGASRPASCSHVTDSSGTEFSATSNDVVGQMPTLTSFDGDTEEGKITQLRSIFPELREHDIKYCLKKSDSNFQATLDELLNMQYLETEGLYARGIDGFFRPDDQPTKRKGKKKSKTSAVQNGSYVDDTIQTGSSSDDAKHQKDITFLADRFDVPVSKVSDIYYSKHCSSGVTAIEILDEYLAHGIVAEDEAGQEQAADLARKYRHIPEKYMTTIVQVTSSIPQFADDLAGLLNKHFTKNPWTQKMDLGYRLTPLPQDEIEGFVPTSPRSLMSNSTRPNLAPRATSAPGPVDYNQALQSANNFHNNRRDAIASATLMNRKGASNSLYRQAAGYYADRAREQGHYAQQATAVAADLLVDQNSSANSIDLHGVHVQDGLRIARARVQGWWDGLGEFRSRKARDQPFTVITGLGRHSAGGVSQMRQAVARGLLLDGWRIQVETGRFVINGRQSR